MKKRTLHRALVTLVSILALVATLPSNAETPAKKKPTLEQTMKAQMEESMRSICSEDAVLKCLGITLQRCKDSVEKTLKKCDHLFPKNAKVAHSTDAHGQCVEDSMPAMMGVPTDKISACMGTTRNNNELFPGKTDLVAKQNSKPSQPAKAKLKPIPAIDIKTVTLPVYQNSTMISHLSDNKHLQAYEKIYGTKPLPRVMLATQDTLSVVAKYYRKKLPDFVEYKLHNGILFLEKGNKDFKISRDIKHYVSTPHVMIEKDTHDPMAPNGTKSKIDIAYRK